MAIVKKGGSGPRFTILTWFWRQPGARFEYTASHVNAWAASIKANTTIPVRIACVTDLKDGIDDWIEIIAPPKDLDHLFSENWSAKKGLPQCYRRLTMWRKDAAKIFGERFMWMDLDVVITGNIDHLIKREEDVLLLQGTSSQRPYNGGFGIITAGSRPHVYERITPQRIKSASERYLGSDQAWLAYVLGFTETTIGRNDGVYCMSAEKMQVPPGSCICFFPGTKKAFPDGSTWGFKGNGTKVPCAVSRVLAFNDGKGYGKRFNPEILIDRADQALNNDFVFVRLDQQGEAREVGKNLVKALNDRKIKTLPSLLESQLYDDKGEQLKFLKNWMPKTYHIKSKAEAVKLGYTIKLPLISKSIDGASSAGVRLIKDREDLLKEIEEVFSETGRKSVYDRVQKDYVYWQEFIPNNDCDYRVIVMGDFIYGLKRFVKKGTVFASGSGSNTPLTFVDPKERAAAKLCMNISKAVGFKWMAFDVIYDGVLPLVVEVSSSWSEQAYYKCDIFTNTFEKTGRGGKDYLLIAKDILLGGHKYFGIKGESQFNELGGNVENYYILLKTCTLGLRGSKIKITERLAKGLRINKIVGDPIVETPVVVIPEKVIIEPEKDLIIPEKDVTIIPDAEVVADEEVIPEKKRRSRRKK